MDSQKDEFDAHTRALKAKLREKCGKLVPITDHPDYKALMDKYARLDKKSCPQKYLPCKASDIQQVTELKNMYNNLKTQNEEKECKVNSRKP